MSLCTAVVEEGASQEVYDGPVKTSVVVGCDGLSDLKMQGIPVKWQGVDGRFSRALSANSSCSTAMPMSPKTSQEDYLYPQWQPDLDSKESEEELEEDEDDDDEEGFQGKPLWNYSGPPLEELLAAEAAGK
eukprot:CAMPEP_0170591304 /NCGR_PEP_ID=MMETSP0224-20130122/12332_1 /TAXON_ID=285029 /ORGANISM="Togula jolla, Strain CCCM 725" /LENGTH=130 /DNA_ID=CAMNT_0010915159 /DNA_START=69 /DNA_END=461 /DNA_ORIENTATION=-